MKIPRELHGCRMPAEWEPHEATWLSWPHNEETWPGNIEKVWRLVTEMIAAITRGERVHLNVNSIEMEQQAKRYLHEAGAGEVVFHHFPTNDAWCRDCGAIVVAQGENRLALNWQYNAWGNKYPPFHDDNNLAKRMAGALNLPVVSLPWVLEGGSVDVNGQGLLLTTEPCLLNENRNPGMSREEIEQVLCGSLGVETVLWLDAEIVGDDTDGHIDQLARFVSPDTVLTVVEHDPADANYASLQHNHTRLERICAEHSLQLLMVPMPAPLLYQSQRLPASYANFYVANTVVLVPGFDCPQDEVARELLAACFSSREVVQLDCRELVRGLGAFHCLTQQVPVAGESRSAASDHILLCGL